MDKIINTSIYIVYGIIAIISTIISYKVSIVMALFVIAIETLRIMAIYKKAYIVIVLVFMLNTFLIGYNSFKSQQAIDYKNNQIVKSNETLNKYISTKDLRADTLQKLNNNIKELEEISIDWWLLVLVYLILELCLIFLIIGINKQDKQIAKPQSAKYTGTRLNKNISKVNVDKELKSVEVTQEKPIDNEQLEYVGSYREYAETKGISRATAQKLFIEYTQEGKLITKNRKKYLRG